MSWEVVPQRGGPQALPGIFEVKVLGVGMIVAENELSRRRSRHELDRIRVGGFNISIKVEWRYCGMGSNITSVDTVGSD